MIRVAFILSVGQNWLGGYNYIRNLVQVLAENRSLGIEPVLFATDHTANQYDVMQMAHKHGVELIHNNVFSRAASPWTVIKTVLAGSNIDIEHVFVSHRIDVIFESAMFFGRHLGMPVIAWLPDFQHRRLRELFGWMQYWKRELGFRAQIASGRTLMVSSHDAAANCEQYYPATKGRISVVPFSVRIAVEPRDINLQDIRDRYGLPRLFFYLPNQFWKHKNHEIVISALNELRGRGTEIVVAASGHEKDPRFPGLFQDLQKLVAEFDLKDNFQFLGMIPYSDLQQLMLASVAVINPSLFEGWSTTVEEAKSLGVPLILSNINVHREQAAGRAHFFDPNSSSDLADAFQLALETNESRVGMEWDELISNNAEQLRAYGAAFADAVIRALDR